MLTEVVIQSSQKHTHRISCLYINSLRCISPQCGFENIQQVPKNIFCKSILCKKIIITFICVRVVSLTSRILVNVDISVHTPHIMTRNDKSNSKTNSLVTILDLINDVLMIYIYNLTGANNSTTNTYTINTVTVSLALLVT